MYDFITTNSGLCVKGISMSFSAIFPCSGLGQVASEKITHSQIGPSRLFHI